MKYLGIHLAIGFVLVAQATIRGWKYHPIRDMESLLVHAGLVLLWPGVLVGEVRQWWRDRKYR